MWTMFDDDGVVVFVDKARWLLLSRIVSGLVHPSFLSGLSLLIPCITGVVTHLRFVGWAIKKVTTPTQLDNHYQWICFPGKNFTGNDGFYHSIWGFPLNVPLNQSIDTIIIAKLVTNNTIIKARCIMIVVVPKLDNHYEIIAMPIFC